MKYSCTLHGGGPCGRLVKDANPLRSKSLVIPCETSQVLLTGGQVLCLGDLPFSPHLTIDLAQNEWNNHGLSMKVDQEFFSRAFQMYLNCSRLLHEVMKDQAYIQSS